MRRRGIFLAVLMSLGFGARARDFKGEIYRSYLAGDMDRWESIIRLSPDRFDPRPDMYDYALAYYGFIGYCLGVDDKSRARPYVDRLEALADSLLEKRPREARVLALRGAVYGFRMSYQPQKIPVIGPKSLASIRDAIAADPECPQAWIEAGNKDWHMPAIFGGSRERALQEYERAIGLMERDPGSIRESWFYLNVNMILADWYAKQSRTFAAHEIYRKLLILEPSFSWARQRLTPEP